MRRLTPVKSSSIRSLTLDTACALTRATSVSAALVVHDYRQETYRHLYQVLRPMQHVAGKRHSITWFKSISIAPVPIGNLAMQHVDKFCSFVLEGGKRFTLVIHRNQEGLEQFPWAATIGEQLVGMATLSADSNPVMLSPLPATCCMGRSILSRCLFVSCQ